MLVRRDVWDRLGGLAPALPLFRDDIDLGWRAQLAGHRVVVVPTARVADAQAGARGMRHLDAVHGAPAPGRPGSRPAGGAGRCLAAGLSLPAGLVRRRRAGAQPRAAGDQGPCPRLRRVRLGHGGRRHAVARARHPLALARHPGGAASRHRPAARPPPYGPARLPGDVRRDQRAGPGPGCRGRAGRDRSDQRRQRPGRPGHRPDDSADPDAPRRLGGRAGRRRRRPGGAPAGRARGAQRRPAAPVERQREPDLAHLRRRLARFRARLGRRQRALPRGPGRGRVGAASVRRRPGGPDGRRAGARQPAPVRVHRLPVLAHPAALPVAPGLGRPGLGRPAHVLRGDLRRPARRLRRPRPAAAGGRRVRPDAAPPGLQHGGVRRRHRAGRRRCLRAGPAARGRGGGPRGPRGRRLGPPRSARSC